MRPPAPSPSPRHWGTHDSHCELILGLVSVLVSFGGSGTVRPWTGHPLIRADEIDDPL